MASAPRTLADSAVGSSQLDRTSFVPLYYQLQELLKEAIESGTWQPGDRLPSEPALASSLGVSRVVVRRALAILEDDHQIIRMRGRGTFVAPPKLDHRAGGLARLLERPRADDVTLNVLDARCLSPERSIRSRLGAADTDEIFRLTTLLSVRRLPVAISYSFFRAPEVTWLRSASKVGRPLPPTLVLADHGTTLTRSEVSIETSQCGQFEADQFGIERRAAVFLVLCTEYCRGPDSDLPFEVARVEYRGDLMQFRLELAAESNGSLAATWALYPNASLHSKPADAT